MKIVIIKYNAGNVQSVSYALQRLGVDAAITDHPDEITSADRVIFPGVGNAGSAMEYLRKSRLDKVIISLRQPVLGICLGLQLMCEHSEEENTRGLGIFAIAVKKFSASPGDDQPAGFKIPHMGWNNVYDLSTKLFSGVKENAFVYNVHSYYAELSPQTIATTDYIIPYSAALHKDNFYGVQFHAEKSAKAGQQVLSNFLTIV